MANSKKIHIRTVTVERYLIPGGPLKASVLFCTGCGVLTEMLTLDHASASTGVSMRDLFRLSENGPIHSAETDSGQIMICRESMSSISAGVVG